MAATRRQFLHRIGALGGAAATFGAMQTMGLFGASAAYARPALSPTAGNGVKVVILGAGIAGLCNSLELERAGFDVTVLEARDRLGGRNWTIRGGSKVKMNGEDDQTCTFADGQYFNAGPARLPSHHQNVLGYCKELGVPLEVEVNSSRSAYIMGSNGVPMRDRQAINDTRGRISELLAKAINKGALDAEMTPDEKQRLIPFLRAYGDLQADGKFTGTERSGLKVRPGAANQVAEAFPPATLNDLLANERLPLTLFEDNIDMQATMFQPVGGMDRIPAGFERAIKSPILRNSEVMSIHQSSSGVSVVRKDTVTDKTSTIHGDYLICTIPLSVLSHIHSNFDRPVKKAIASVVYDSSNKIAFETPRFWEKEEIYGGISFVAAETALVWYPSYGLHTERGVLLACYNSGHDAVTFAKRPIAEQIAMAADVVEKLHPGHRGDLSAPMVVNWSKVPYNLGPWPSWNPNPTPFANEDIHNAAFDLLNQPHGRVYFSGAHLSQTPGWQEGAILSAHRTIGMLSDRVAATKLASTR